MEDRILVEIVNNASPLQWISVALTGVLGFAAVWATCTANKMNRRSMRQLEEEKERARSAKRVALNNVLFRIGVRLTHDLSTSPRSTSLGSTTRNLIQEHLQHPDCDGLDFLSCNQLSTLRPINNNLRTWAAKRFSSISWNDKERVRDLISNANKTIAEQ